MAQFRSVSFALLIGMTVLGAPSPSMAGAVGQGPVPPRCAEVVAANGGSTNGIWRGQFAGDYERGMFREFMTTFSRVGCFRSKAACERWIYDVRSWTIFHNERHVGCRPL